MKAVAASPNLCQKTKKPPKRGLEAKKTLSEYSYLTGTKQKTNTINNGWMFGREYSACRQKFIFAAKIRHTSFGRIMLKTAKQKFDKFCRAILPKEPPKQCVAA
jgi:hypothetical protein